MGQNSCVLIPLMGLEWNGQLIKLGDTREQMEQVFGQPDRVIRAACYYQAYDLRFDLADDGTISFIECIGGIDGRILPTIYGVSAFEADAGELLELLKQHNGPDIDDSEAGYAYSFRNISVGVYREITPEDVDGMLREMLNMDLTQMGNIDIEEEKKKAYHWATIGIGKQDYYA